MATDYIVVPAADAETAREALGRLFLLPPNGAGTHPIPGQVTQYYVDPRMNADGTQAALGPRDSFLETALGKTVPCNAGDYTLPSEFASLEDDWFPAAVPVGGLPPDVPPPPPGGL